MRCPGNLGLESGRVVRDASARRPLAREVAGSLASYRPPRGVVDPDAGATEAGTASHGRRTDASGGDGVAATT